MLRPALLTMIFLTGACSPGVGDDPPVEPNGPTPVPPGPIVLPQKITVSGTAELHAMTLGGDVVEPLGVTLSAMLAPRTSTHAWIPLELVHTDDAHFEIKAVPKDSAYYVQHDGGWVVSARSSLDLSRFHIGRPDAEPCSYASTKLVLEAEGLEAWSEGHELQLVSANTGAMVFGLESYAIENRMAGGSTRIEEMSIRWFGTGEALIDGSSGDQAIITQLVEKTSGMRSYRAVSKAMIPSAFRMVDGETTTVRGTFSDAGEMNQIGVRVDPGVVRQIAQDLNPTAVHVSSMMYVDAEPFGGEHGHASSTPDLVIMDLGTGSSTPFDVDLAFLNPFPVGWTLFYQLNDAFRVSILAEGATEPADVLVSLNTNNLYDGLLSNVAPLRVGPAKNIQIDGKGAFNRLRISTDTPELTWEAPELGTADAYGVSIYRVFARDGRTETEHRTTFAIDGRLRSMRVPPAVLERGETYVFFISAHANGGPEAFSTPYEGHFPEAYAEAISGLVSVRAD